MGRKIAIHPGGYGFVGEKNVFAQAAITFELRFGKELVQSRIVRELLVLATVVEDVWRFVTGKRGLDVKDVAELTGMGILGVADRAMNAMDGVGRIVAEGRQPFDCGWRLLMRKRCVEARRIGG